MEETLHWIWSPTGLILSEEVDPIRERLVGRISDSKGEITYSLAMSSPSMINSRLTPQT
jgi:hypothetical protein